MFKCIWCSIQRFCNSLFLMTITTQSQPWPLQSWSSLVQWKDNHHKSCNGWLAGVWLLCNTCELITVLCMIILSSTLQRRRWAFLLIAMPEIYNRLTGYKGIKVPAIPNLESNFFYHFLHTHTDPTSLSLSPHTSYLFVGIFPEKELIESCNFCFAKYFEAVPHGRGNLLHCNCICSSNQPSQKNIKRS